MNRLIRELANENSIDMQSLLQKPHIHRLFKEEFNLTDREIHDLERLIIKHCNEILNSFVKSHQLIPLKNKGATSTTNNSPTKLAHLT